MMIYKDWLNEWLMNYVETTCKTRTYERYSQAVNKHILNRLGDYEIDELSPSILQNFVSDLLKNGNLRTQAGLSSNSVNCIISVIQSSLKTAKMIGYTQSYVGDKIIRPKIVEKQVSCFTIQEQDKIEKYILSSNKIKLYGIILCLYTGLRIGELLALEVNDIDFLNSSIIINKTCYYVSKRRMIDTPKTISSNRVIPIPKQILPLLKEIIMNTKHNFLIADDKKPISIRSYQRSFELLLNKLHIEHKGFHSLRHTFATRALECGMDIKTLSEILGHRNPTVTLARYAHSMFEHKLNMMNKLGEFLYKKSNDT